MHKSLESALLDLEQHGQLLRIKAQVSADLEMAEIHRRIFEAKGPAILFENVEGSPFRAASNLYGTYERTDFLFRHSMEAVQRLIEIKADPSNALKNPLRYLKVPFTALTALPRKSILKPATKYGTTAIDQLPQIKSWPMDGGAFVTLPQVFTLPPGETNVMKSNIGMYRIQLSGNEYKMNEEIGLHYQIHRGIGVHHQAYNESDEPFRCSIFVGGPPSHAFAAIMPLPEGLSELTFAGLLAGRAVRYFKDDQGHIINSDSDFVITGTIVKNKKKPEGPFGDHLGYYSLQHDFPYMKVDRVYHRKNAIWHFTAVGRPPQEDSSFGYLIHQLVKKLTPGEFPGLKSIHAVDAAGVHPLLLAVGHERYMPFRERVPEEILTIANRIIGSGQTSLAKFLFIAASDDDPNLDAHHIGPFFEHVLSRVRWERDLHFQTKTTIDTLDYSGSGWNAGSKVVVACRGEVIRTLGTELPQLKPISNVSKVSVIAKGILGLTTKKWSDYKVAQTEIDAICSNLQGEDLSQFPLIIVCDNADFMSQSLNNFLWAAFTRANPSHDIHGVDSFTKFKHWGCNGPLVIDARIKSHHAPELVVDPVVAKKVDAMFAKSGELYGRG